MENEKIRLYRYIRRMVFASMLAAMSIILGKYLAFTQPAYRISFENLPVLIAGIYLGPVYGLAVGGIADLLGSLLVGYDINPIIAIGASSIGLVSGIVWRLLKRLNNLARSAITVASAHLIGSVIIKTTGIWLYYSSPFLFTLGIRTLNYLCLGIVEYFIIILLLRRKAIRDIFE